MTRVRVVDLTVLLCLVVPACGSDAAPMPEGGSGSAIVPDAGIDARPSPADVDAAGPYVPGVVALDAAIIPPETKPIAFTPSNVSLAQLRIHDGAGLADVVIDGDTCGFESSGEVKTFRCTDNSLITAVKGVMYRLIRNGNDPTIDVFIARSWTIGARGKLSSGKVVLVATDTITIEGKLQSDALTRDGPGGGATKSPGGAGGTFCGVGGNGAYSTDPKPASYGTPDLTPPVLGSGGGGAFASSGGFGGGFLQLVAGKKIHVTPTGQVTAVGGGGFTEGGGGGSGGAILLEAPAVVVEGAVSANGGGGATTARGENGRADATRASGGPGAGGRGSADDAIDGEDAMSVANRAGGGGAAGWIRINTAPGGLEAPGIISPRVGSKCASNGRLRPLESP
jgi:hypothetical protein